jgi:predicted kinase
MATAIVGIGVPGSGKSTVLKALAEKDGLAYVCPDDIRAKLTGNASDQTRNAEVWDRAYKQITRHLSQGRTVVVDATNAKPEDRQQLVRHCRPLANRILGMWFRTPLDVCLARQARRDRQVPDAYIRSSHNWLTRHPPRLSEGFDFIIEIDTSL